MNAHTTEAIHNTQTTIESVVVSVGWSAGSKTHRGYRAVRPNPKTGEPEPYTSHTACGTRGGWAGLGVARVLPDTTPITCTKCGVTDGMDLTDREVVWSSGTVSMASGQRREAIKHPETGEVQVKKVDGKTWFTTKDVKVIASFKA